MRINKKIVCFDQDGKQLGPSEDMPGADSVPNGLSAIPSYVVRLFGSGAEFASLMVTVPDGTGGCGLTRRNHECQVLFPIDWRRYPEQERCLREFFTRHGIAPAHDYLAGNGGVPDATRILMYALPDSSERVALLCTELFAGCFGVSAGDVLQFTLQDG